jgi:heat shock protein HslJ
MDREQSPGNGPAHDRARDTGIFLQRARIPAGKKKSDRHVYSQKEPRTSMKSWFFLGIGLVILAVMLSGCTSQPAPAPASTQTPAPAAPQVPVVQTTATAAGPALIGTNWQLGWFDDTKGVWSKVAEGSTITAKFSGDGKVSGHSGCSDYVTDYQLLKVPSSGVWFRRPAIPDKVCQTPNGVMSQQSAYYTDLEWSQTYAMTGGQLVFFDKTGKKILQFDPAP